MELEGYHGGDSASLIPGERGAVGSEPPRRAAGVIPALSPAGCGCWSWSWHGAGPTSRLEPRRVKARLSQGGVDGAASHRPLPASGGGRVILGTGEGLQVSHMDSSPSTHIGSNPSIPTGSTPPTHTRADTSTLMGSSSVDPCSPSHPLWGSAPPLLLGAHGWDGCWASAHTEAGDGPTQVELVARA